MSDRFHGIYRAHQAMVRTVIFQIAGASQVNDLTQEAFVRVWKKLPAFRGQSSLRSWIYRIAVNVALDAVRAQARRAEDFLVPDVASESPDAERLLMSRELVAKGLAALSADHRAVVVLALLHEFSLSEVAEILGVSLGTVKSRLHYGRQHFQSLLEEKGEPSWKMAKTI
ncbi:MAG: sigma-70 family RNA polymerase sigma factor [Bdellovibrionales bacterium]|nr:sigma-70 family RNA polymerase sigma factor [Bdellovibrionales bacterium]